jgi:phosphatidylglycerol:prolipoprotein diacylglycerol transferase
VEQFREPDIQLGLFFDHFSMGQLLSAPMMVAGLGLVIYAILKRRSKEGGV